MSKLQPVCACKCAHTHTAVKTTLLAYHRGAPQSEISGLARYIEPKARVFYLMKVALDRHGNLTFYVQSYGLKSAKKNLSLIMSFGNSITL